MPPTWYRGMPGMRLCLLGMALALSPGASGCAPDYGTPVRITGTAILDGKPLANTGFRFHCMEAGLPANLRTLSGTTNEAGKFELPRVYPQEYQVSFFTLAYPAKQKFWPDGEPIILASPNLGPLGKYAAEVTPLRARVSEDSTNFDFALKSK